MDFTIKKYLELLAFIRISGYAIQTMEDFLSSPESHVIVIRHDVDERPANALLIARAEYRSGIESTFYFRIGKISNDPDVIKQIAGMGHEIGYHYEDYSSCNGDHKKAARQFQKHLGYFRRFYPVRTVCMHGSSMSDFDNRNFWRHYSLEEFGLIGEPYLSIDYSDVLYLTDTARNWDGGKYSIRDCVENGLRVEGIKKTEDIIDRLEKKELPNKIVLQSHTLWTDALPEWIWLEVRELTRNRLKNILQHSPGLKKAALNLIRKYSN